MTRAAAYTYRGFLYGHYDSRGGTTFVEADSRAAALRRYVIGFGYQDGDPTQFDIPTADWLRMIEDEDFLCEATIESDEELIVGIDLDGEFTGGYDPDTGVGRTAWVPKPADGVDTAGLVMGCITPGAPIVIRYGAKPGDDWIAPRFDDDAYGLLFDSVLPPEL
jgi:hypothetical protein